MNKIQFDIMGMTCSACQARIEKVVSGLNGVNDVTVNLLKNSMSVSIDASQITSDNIITAVEKTGYGAKLHQTGQKQHQTAQSNSEPLHDELKFMTSRLFISIIFTIPLFYIAMGHMVGLPIPTFFIGPENALTYAFTQFLLTIPVIFINFSYYRSGFKTLFAGAPNMDSLIAIGSGAAVLYGIYAIYKIGIALGNNHLGVAEHVTMHLYFESAAMILALITLGKYLEARAKGKTSDAITKLMNLAPKTATILQEGLEKVIASDDVRVNDILIVKAGESIPVDGVITEGSAFINESAITGESMPIEKQTGDNVTCATLNESGYFLMQATRVGEDTTLSQIVKLVDEATSSKAPIARLADKISGVFVPIVIAIAIVATIIWLVLGYSFEFALSIGISILVISCPCALGLATPTAIMVGTGRGAANGILFKSAKALEITQSINTVVLDKTGTITEGKPVVTDIITGKNTQISTLLKIAASLEKMSGHPLGKAIVQESSHRQISLDKVTDFNQITGQGISGMINTTRYFAGNRNLMISQHIDLQEEIIISVENIAQQGKTPLFFSDSTNLLGIIAVADVIKPTSQEAVSQLHALGIDVIMLTGDNAKTAAAIQKQVGINHIIAEVLPQDKANTIRQLKEQGKNVAMVGDGVNDAPALAEADVGIAIGAGTDIAIESADIVLMKSDLLDAVTAIALSKAVMRNIRQNLFWAFFYNAAGIPIAAGLFYGIWKLTLNPMIAAAAMSLSSVSVVSNALRLRFFKPVNNTSIDNQTSSATTEVSTTVTETQLSHNRSPIMEKQIKIEGMSCGHCSGRVEKALKALSGVNAVHVDLATKQATVSIDNSVTDAALKAAITDAGYDVIAIS